MPLLPGEAAGDRPADRRGRAVETKASLPGADGGEGFFGSSTPAAQVPVKANAPPREQKPKGARPRRYRLPKKYRPRCRRAFTPQTPGVLPKSLYGNQLIANAAVLHYRHGMPPGRIGELLGVAPGPLAAIFHRRARLFDAGPKKLIPEYLKAPAKHADETGWRTQGQNGYVWLFATRKVSFGSNSPAGANTRGVLTTVIQTLKKQGRDPTNSIKQALDRLSRQPKIEPYHLLFRTQGPG